jgi:hypothetical protein
MLFSASIRLGGIRELFENGTRMVSTFLPPTAFSPSLVSVKLFNGQPPIEQCRSASAQ